MAHVKWLKRICLIDQHFQGPFQEVEYNYYPHKDSDRGKRPVTFMKVNSLIQIPLDYSTLDTGLHRIYGLAWSGTGTISKVNLSFDKGKTWKAATLWQDPKHPYAWSYWSYDWSADQPGEYTIMSRADSSGNIQPIEAEWNRLGYGYNAVVRHRKTLHPLFIGIIAAAFKIFNIFIFGVPLFSPNIVNPALAILAEGLLVSAAVIFANFVVPGLITRRGHQ